MGAWTTRKRVGPYTITRTGNRITTSTTVGTRNGRITHSVSTGGKVRVTQTRRSGNMFKRSTIYSSGTKKAKRERRSTYQGREWTWEDIKFMGTAMAVLLTVGAAALIIYYAWKYLLILFIVMVLYLLFKKD
jgi:hypothetical protein